MWQEVIIIFSIYYFASATKNYWGNEVCFSDSDCGGFTCDIQLWCTRTLVGKTFWNTDICNSDNDCTGLTSCHPTFGCTQSFVKTSIVVFAVFISLSIISYAVKWLIMRYRRKRHRHTHYVPHSPTMPTNQPLWNQNLMRTTTMFHPQTRDGNPQNFQQQQPVANDDPPSYTECKISVCPSPSAVGHQVDRPTHGHSN